jgi:hypothetical protein
MAQGLSLADACRLFEALTGGLPQSAKELSASYRAWMKAHHPDITGRQDPLSLEAVQWMNAAYDVLKAQDWTKARPERKQAQTAAAGGDRTATANVPEWTNVGGSSRNCRPRGPKSRRRKPRSYPPRWKDEQLRRCQEQREKERREKEEEHRRWAEAIKRRNEA